MQLIGAGVGDSAGAEFDDVLFWPGAAGQLRFTLRLQGSEAAAGMDPGLNTASVDATLSADDRCCFLSGGFGRLTAPGTITVTVPVAADDSLNFELALLTGVYLQEAGHGISDFIDTLDIPRIELLDQSGNFVRDVTLSDSQGNILGAPAAVVPEPDLWPPLAALIAMRILARNRRTGGQM
jgi:hypothetical protein